MLILPAVKSSPPCWLLLKLMTMAARLLAAAAVSALRAVCNHDAFVRRAVGAASKWADPGLYLTMCGRANTYKIQK